MAKREKRLSKILQNPKTVSFKDLDKILQEAGFEVRQPRSGSSHYVYFKGEIQMSVPFKRPFIKQVYVKRVIELLGGEKDE